MKHLPHGAPEEKKEEKIGVGPLVPEIGNESKKDLALFTGAAVGDSKPGRSRNSPADRKKRSYYIDSLDRYLIEQAAVARSRMGLNADKSEVVRDCIRSALAHFADEENKDDVSRAKKALRDLLTS